MVFGSFPFLQKYKTANFIGEAFPFPTPKMTHAPVSKKLNMQTSTISRSSLTSDSSLQHLQEWDINSPHLHHAPEMLPQ
ncbi:hypothetical protein M404DRAFT_998799 [Pisolithus tinctorius Marx 270]|uniref:Uncharacterized protein n=1 Tax=Pisolithus tinctorius Marx 270 TaxID=870435 RepID=A0A0C3JC57_PISTI|nr:hypothetical protein M404DRAFT_998799 [Pisolithus tinctorius Marx 270]